ncbi:hypothetical protein BS47DRAFT_1089347 [Hydnum rufescens UP504]|uniref:DUF6534 domain-containing protein n=1 Tax=Hydnum rufescens UP504 TaxID=1448309 RepID=A0A9P6AUJ0_9AGAM|nr:hypothetical protein BS47DRAFT_1089347 [Hydnum rufescens UP504]
MGLQTKYVLESTSGLVLDNTVGAVLVSVIASASLFGILTTQCYYYALRFKQDPRWLKCIVAALWIIDTMHQMAVSAMIFQYTVHHYGDPGYLRLSTLPVSFFIMLEPLPAIIVQLYFTRRLYHLNRKLWPVAAFTGILSILGFVTGAACGIRTYTHPHLADYKKDTWLVTIWLVTSSVCDIAVTIAVAWTLYTSRTGFKQTDILLVRLIVWTVNTGALPAFVSSSAMPLLIHKLNHPLYSVLSLCWTFSCSW